MTDAARLDAILARLTDLEKTSAMAHVQIQSSVDRMGDAVEALADRVRIQNGRVTSAEQRLAELETKARIIEHYENETDDRHDIVAARIWAFISGAGLVALGALLGYFI
jgi:hypothetical protein